MADHLQVALVAADRTVWSGEASMVLARTVAGEIGVLRGHTPVLSLLTESVVEIVTADGDRLYAAADGGFISVANDRVSILSQYAMLADEIDVESARSDLEEARSADDEKRVRRAEAQIAAAEKVR